jgi:hypothetical protein
MSAGVAVPDAWRTRQFTTASNDDVLTAVEACLDGPAVAETPTPPTIVPPDWEDLLAGRLAQCHLPGGVLDRLIAEAVADTMSAMAATLERQLRFRIQREQRAQLQTCDDY